MAATGHFCGATTCSLYPAACLAGGVIAGLLLGVWGVRSALGYRGLATAGLTAGLVGCLGCVVAGAAGLVVLMVGLAGGLAPVLALRRA